MDMKKYFDSLEENLNRNKFDGDTHGAMMFNYGLQSMYAIACTILIQIETELMREENEKRVSA